MTSSAAPETRGETREVSLTITRDPSLVRTVRLVAASLARRAGLDAAAVEEVRLAVGESCAVLLGAGSAEPGNGLAGSGGHPVTVTLRLEQGLVAEITGPAAADTPEVDADLAELGDLVLDPWVLVRGLREDVEVSDEDGTTRVRLAWSA